MRAARLGLIACSLCLLPAGAIAGLAERPDARAPDAPAAAAPAVVPLVGAASLETAPLAPAAAEPALSLSAAADAVAAGVEPARAEILAAEPLRGGGVGGQAARAEGEGASEAGVQAGRARFDGTRRDRPGETPAAAVQAKAPHWLVRGRRVPAVTLALAAVNGAVYAVTSAAPPGATRPFILAADRFQEAFVSGSLPAMAREAATLLTASFIHANLEHLLYNVLYLLFFGAVAERVWGARRLVSVYLAGAFVGALAAVPLLHTSGSGASGAICALAGALIGPYLAMLKSWRDLGIVWGPALVGAGAAALVLVVSTLAMMVAGPVQGGIGVSTHAAAGLAGAALGLWWTWRARRGAGR